MERTGLQIDHKCCWMEVAVCYPFIKVIAAARHFLQTWSDPSPTETSADIGTSWRQPSQGSLYFIVLATSGAVIINYPFSMRRKPIRFNRVRLQLVFRYSCLEVVTMGQPIQYQMPRVVGEARPKTAFSRICAKSPQRAGIKVRK